MSVTVIASEMATSLGLGEDELFRRALVCFLRDRKRQGLRRRLDILARYGADSLADLESRIARGVVMAHPAWEDLIVAENLGARLAELDVYLDRLRDAQVAGRSGR